MTKEELIKLLNEDLEKEFGAAVQYVQHAAAITGAQFMSIQAELIVHSNEEMMHAQSLSDQIASLGGVPTVDVAKRYVSTDSTEMLKQDLTGEEDAIMRYKERIAQAEELGEYGLKDALTKILVMEEEHKRDLDTALGQ